MDRSIARQRFGKHLRTLRTERGFTQEHLAELIGKGTEHISFLERGERSPSFETIIDLATALNTSVSFLMNIDSIENIVAASSDIHVPAVPTSLSLPEPVQGGMLAKQQRKTNLERLQEALQGVQELQALATEYGISDIFQDNGGKAGQSHLISRSDWNAA